MSAPPPPDHKSEDGDGREIWDRIYGTACGTYLKSADVDRLLCNKYNEFKALLHALRLRCDAEIQRSMAAGRIPTVYRVPRDEVRSEFSVRAIGDELKRSLEKDGFAVRASADGSELQVYPRPTVSCDFLNISDGAKAVLRSTARTVATPATARAVPAVPHPPRPRPHPSSAATAPQSARRVSAVHTRFGATTEGRL